MSTAAEDLTGKARLRDAAIEAFATKGFDESLRAIALRAGVTAGLVRHHFGSKENLRAECDATVLLRFRALKEQSMDTAPSLLFAHLPITRDAGLLMVYMLRCIRHGGPSAQAFVESMIAETAAFTANAVAKGILKPSLDEGARVKLLVHQALGGMLVHLGLGHEIELENFQGVMAGYYAETVLPTLELFTYGVFADSSYLDSYLDFEKSARSTSETAQR